MLNMFKSLYRLHQNTDRLQPEAVLTGKGVFVMLMIFLVEQLSAEGLSVLDSLFNLSLGVMEINMIVNCGALLLMILFFGGFFIQNLKTFFKEFKAIYIWLPITCYFCSTLANYYRISKYIRQILAGLFVDKQAGCPHQNQYAEEAERGFISDLSKEPSLIDIAVAVARTDVSDGIDPQQFSESVTSHLVDVVHDSRQPEYGSGQGLDEIAVIRADDGQRRIKQRKRRKQQELTEHVIWNLQIINRGEVSVKTVDQNDHTGQYHIDEQFGNTDKGWNGGHPFSGEGTADQRDHHQKGV